MKAYSKSRFLAFFLVVALWALPYAFAGRLTDKPDKPDLESEMKIIWRVYVPVDETDTIMPSGIQGDFSTPVCPYDIDCHPDLPGGDYYVYDENANNPVGTRHDVWTGREKNLKLSIFRFQVLYPSLSRVELGIVGNYTDPEDPEDDLPFLCSPDDLFSVGCVMRLPQPYEPFTDFMFAFTFSDENYEFDNLPLYEPFQLSRATFSVSDWLTIPDPPTMQIISGDINEGNLEVTRIQEDIWHISYSPCICPDPNVDIFQGFLKVEGDLYLEGFDIYFVRKLVDTPLE
jgi:hypothetical protein